jgi:hypothetical protein
MSLEMSGRNLVFAILIAFGVAYEAIKLWPNSTITARAVKVVEDNIFAPKLYSVSDHGLHETIIAPKPKLPKAQPLPKIDGFDIKGAIDKFATEQKKLTEDEKKKQEAAKDWHWVYSRKLNQWVWKKKTDKKEKDADTAVAATKTAIPTIPTDTKSADSSLNADLGSVVPKTGYAGQGAPTATNQFLSQGEWESLLLKTANTTETKKFVKAYLNHMVTETVFYAIVAKMLASSSVDMQQQGVTALNLTPSAASFVALAKESTGLQTSSPLTSTVTAALTAYQQTKNVDNLEDVLKQQKDTKILSLALQELQTSVQNNLKGTTTNPTGQGGTNTAIYQPFVSILTTLESNSAVASQAQQILSSIQSNSNSRVAEIH